jgi:hypothetical protein
MNETTIERPKFLIDLLAEVDSFEAAYPSHDPVATGETPQGQLSPWLQRMYSLARYYYKQARILNIERDYQNIQGMTGDPEIAEMKYKCDVLMGIMWFCVRAERNLFTAPNVGIREPFTVIRSESADDDDDGFKRFILSILKKG